MRPTTVVAVLVAAIAAALALVLGAPDANTYWHLASGDWVLDHRALLDHDVWSFTRSGAPYTDGAWLGDVVLALAYRIGGWTGLALLRALCLGVAAFFTARIALRVAPHPAWGALVALVAVLASRGEWTDGPQLFSLALFPVVLDVLLASRARVAVLAPLFAAWANLDAGHVAGLAAAAAVALAALVERRDVRAAATVAVACVLATVLAPGDLAARIAPYARALPGGTVDDRATDVLVGSGAVFAVLLLAALAAVLLAGRERIAESLGSPVRWAVLAAAFVAFALASERTVAFAAVTLVPLVATLVPAFVPVRAAIAGVALVVAVAIVAVRAPDAAVYPGRAITSLGTGERVLNEYDWGGYLIRTSPGHATFIDGRGEMLFRPEVLDDYRTAILLRPGYHDVLRRWDITTALLRPTRPLAAALREDGWTLVASDASFVLLRRP